MSLHHTTCLQFYFVDSECHWEETKINQRRQTFCNKVEGYGDICSCTHPDPVVFPQKKVGLYIL